MKYLLSRYNIASDVISGNVAVFNSLTQNLAIFSAEEYTNLTELDSDSQAAKFGFLVPDLLNEFELAQRVNRKLRNQEKDGLALTIVPSEACNFSCGYCYNGTGHSKGNTRLAALNALSYAQSNLHPTESLHVTWYGGEPTMFMKEIREFSKKFLALCDDFGSEYSADILTNGSLLTSEYVEQFVDAKIQHVQISVDWPLETSQRKWGRRDSRDALLEIVKNASLLSKKVSTTIRVNAMPQFLSTFSDFLEIVRPLRGSAAIYLHRVHESNIFEMNDVRSADFRYKSIPRFYEDYLVAKRELRAAGFNQDFYPRSFESSICIAQTDRDLIFTPDGVAKKCVKEISGDGVSLALNRTPLLGTTRIDFYRHGEVAANSECAQCSFLPICHGGCVKDMFESPGEIDGRCTPWRYTLASDLSDFLKEQLCKS